MHSTWTKVRKNQHQWLHWTHTISSPYADPSPHIFWMIGHIKNTKIYYCHINIHKSGKTCKQGNKSIGFNLHPLHIMHQMCHMQCLATISLVPILFLLCVYVCEREKEGSGKHLYPAQSPWLECKMCYKPQLPITGALPVVTRRGRRS